MVFQEVHHLDGIFHMTLHAQAQRLQSLQQDKTLLAVCKSEGIADGDVEGVHVAEAGDVEVTRAARVVRQVETEAPVEA